MEDSNNIFTIAVTINGKSQQVEVVTAETTDGVAFYKCNIASEEITQVRKDTDRWKQLWGSLTEMEIESIGAAIDAYFEKNKITS
ncbi:hypothetical protein [Niabella soli]|uniref:Uncharacterized protein n=1 Tax=Niabella soli DSM 19437 TaxID=929713 RepID=W0F272_9BACT|nr:hypothetical protein [Niabella soli]AHF17150.1 hypothetical protein NIASO_02520 [Niabella soli DSM 19437]